MLDDLKATIFKLVLSTSVGKKSAYKEYFQKVMSTLQKHLRRAVTVKIIMPKSFMNIGIVHFQDLES